MQTIHIDDIIIPEERIRKNFSEEKIDELVQSIQTKGLFHPPVVRTDEQTLVSGENRVRALKRLFEMDGRFTCNGREYASGEIPVLSLTDLSPDDLLEAELEENILRKDLTWQEQVEAKRKLHELRMSQHGETELLSSGLNRSWGYTDTADEIHGEAQPKQRQAVRDSIILADYLDDPDVASAKSEKEAMKIVRKKETQRKREEQARALEGKKLPHVLHHGDAHSVLAEYEAQTFDVICTDPPYGINVDKDQQRDGEYHEYDDSEDALWTAADLVASEGYRVTKPEAHVYFFCDIRKWPQLRNIFWLAGWEPWERPLIWYKGNAGSFGGTDWGPRRTYEAILYAAKNRKPVTALYHDVIDVPKPTQTDHPAGKPSEVYRNLLARSVNPGDTILDPFCGGAPIFSAAQELKITAHCIELNETYYNLAASRLKELEDNATVADLAI